MLRPLVLLLTFVTGATGLVYEVVWQKYLATLLGSHSEATAAVLGLFLAGLSLGYRIFGEVARSAMARSAAGGSARLLLVYGAVEAGIGVYALLFPWLFRGVQGLSLWLPHGSTGMGFAFDVALSGLLLLPPTILMGGTIPLLTQALSRDLADATRLHARVYGFNTAGAGIGALTAAFVLIPWLGLQGVMLVMGTVNVGVGVLLAALDPRSHPPVDLGVPGTAQRPEGFAVYVLVAALGGFAMMAIQTVLNRIGALALGSSPFTFSMIAALFVMAIALGSLGVSALPRVPRVLLLANLTALFLALLWLDTRLAEAPFWAHRLRIALDDVGFGTFHAATFLSMLITVGPAVVLSGATLPLLFDHLKRTAGDLGRTAGILYGWNTVGSLVGALLGGYALLFWLDLHAVYRIALGAILASIALVLPRVTRAPAWAAGAGLALGLALLAATPAWDAPILHSGLFRMRNALPIAPYTPEQVLAFRGWTLVEAIDDPIASISVQEITPPGADRVVAIFNNGKPDSSTGGDYPTVGLAALLPALVAEQIESAFVVGWGTGVSVGELAALDSTREVVVAEISPAVIELDRHFAEANLDALASPKTEVRRSDAYRALLRTDRSFDAIISEPSNPWTAGVEMLYSREFLEAARDHLAPGGVYVQWIHQYELDAASLELVLRTYGEVFGSVSIWYGAHSDLLLLGFPEAERRIDLARLEARVGRPDLAAGLSRCGISGLPALLAHELWPTGVLHGLALEGPLHTLQHPRLNDLAARAFFRGAAAELPFWGAGAAAQRGEAESLTGRYLDGLGPDAREAALAELVGETCRMRSRRCVLLLADWLLRSPRSPAALAALEDALRQRRWFGPPISRNEVGQLQALLRGVEGTQASVPAANAARATELYRRYHGHGVGLRPEALLAIWERCEPDPAAPEVCAEGLEEARALVRGDAGDAPAG